ncbi:hypothetical protein [Terriglobus roseus]|uniref:hypothetical protein n=1 Tax=Terriglobus roseus TaxID=392734 RepID=UPI001114DADC|nr:hypothetical protein [Terriglobus roseus]
MRRLSGHLQDPVRFRDLAWEEAAVQQTRSARNDTTLHVLQDSLRAKQGAYDDQRQTAQKRGWTSADACGTAHATSFAIKQKPPDVMPSSEHEGVARRVCVSRVVRVAEAVDRLLSDPSQLDADTFKEIALEVQKPALLEALLDILQRKRPHDTSLQERRAQLHAFNSDWKRWAATADGYTDPPIGTARDQLHVQSITQLSAERVFAFLLHLPNAPQPDAEDIASFIGGSLESYSRCVVDGQTQLRTKLESWNEMQRTAPERDARAQQQVQQMCRAEIADEEERSKEIAALRIRVSEESARIEAERIAITIPRTMQVLNNASCRLTDAP